MRLAILTMAACIATQAVANENQSPWKVTGYLDIYALRSDGNLPTGTNLAFRGYDIRNRGAMLAAGQLAISYAGCSKLPVGFKISVITGENSEINNLTEPSTESYRELIDEAYLTWASPNGATSVDFGKFDTWVGYETKVSGDNDNYSRGFLWTLAQPVYHAGGRVKHKFNDQWDAGVFAVTGWNELNDSNDELTFGATLGYTKPKFSVRLNVLDGKQGNDNDAGGLGTNAFTNESTDVNLIDVVATAQVTDKLKIGVNYDHATAETPGDEGKWSGAAGYARYSLNPGTSIGLRAERFDDKDGWRTGTPNLKLDSFTANVDFHVAPNAMLRVEGRFDKANKNVFEGGNGARKERQTISVSAFVKI